MSVEILCAFLAYKLGGILSFFLSSKFRLYPKFITATEVRILGFSGLYSIEAIQ